MADPPEFGALAQAVGEVCVWWRRLEHVVEAVCYVACQFHNTAFEKPEIVMVVGMALSHADIRQKIAATKAIAGGSVMPEKPYATLERLLNRIDNELRVERNRCIHDMWDIEEGKITRTRGGAKIVRPQSHKRELQMEHTTEFASPAEVSKFAETLKEAFIELATFLEEMERGYAQIKPNLESAQRVLEESRS
jgi:nitrite reductase/ring-hydroxylating ferredoxin subunit